MTDQTENASEYAELLAHLDGCATEFQGHPIRHEDAAAAIRALEAKVHRLEVTKAGLWEVSRKDFVTMSELRADRDRLAGEVERLMRAAKVADWEQVRLNGGPPCFHIEEAELRKDWAPDVLDYRFCLRAERWPGHPTFHKFVTLHDAIRAANGDGNG